MTSGQGYRFDAFTLDCDSGELRRDGVRVPLQEKPLQVLLLLLENAGKLVTREELRHRLWPADTFVDFDRNVNTAVKKLRAALSDSAEQPQFVETVPRRGYRFLGSVQMAGPRSPFAEEPRAAVTGPPGAAHSSRGPARLSRGFLAPAALAACLALALTMAGGSFPSAPVHTAGADCPPRVTLAVLSFQHEHQNDRRTDQRILSFAAGLTDELAGQLGRTGEGALAVISGRAVQKYECSNKDVREIGRALGAQFVLEGKVRREKDGLRVFARLVDARDQTLVLSDSFDVPKGAADAAPAAIAAQLARSLALCLRPPPPGPATARAGF